MKTLLDILWFLGVFALVLGGIVALNLLGYWQATRGMTPEEKEAFNKYIEENGLYGDDDFF